MLAVRERLTDFGNASIAVVTFATVERLAQFRKYLALPFPVLADPDLVLYSLVGAGKGSTRQVWSLGTLTLYARLLLRGRSTRHGRQMHQPNDDLSQLGADLVIGPDGLIEYLSLPASPDARPPVSELVDAVRRLGNQ